MIARVEGVGLRYSVTEGGGGRDLGINGVVQNLALGMESGLRLKAFRRITPPGCIRPDGCATKSAELLEEVAIRILLRGQRRKT